MGGLLCFGIPRKAEECLRGHFIRIHYLSDGAAALAHTAISLLSLAKKDA